MFEKMSDEKLTKLLSSFREKEENDFAEELSDRVFTEILRRMKKRSIYKMDKKKFDRFKRIYMKADELVKSNNTRNNESGETGLGIIVNHGKFGHSIVTIRTPDELGYELDDEEKNLFSDMVELCDTFSFYKGGLMFKVNGVIVEAR